MTLKELKIAIDDILENEGASGDIQVEAAVQRDYPFLNQITNTCAKRDAEGNVVGLVLAIGDNKKYTSKKWWSEYDVEVGEDGEPKEEEE